MEWPNSLSLAQYVYGISLKVELMMTKLRNQLELVFGGSLDITWVLLLLDHFLLP